MLKNLQHHSLRAVIGALLDLWPYVAFFFIAHTGDYLSFNTLGFRLAPSSQHALKHVSLLSISFLSMASILATFVAEEALWQLRLNRIAMGGVGLTQL